MTSDNVELRNEMRYAGGIPDKGGTRGAAQVVLRSGAVIREADWADIPQIIDAGALFYQESNFDPGGFDPVQFAYRIGQMYSSEEDTILVAVHDGKVVGFIMFDTTRHYTTYLVSHMFLFFVLPAARRLGAGPALVKAATLFSQDRGAKYFYGSSSAGFNDGGRNERGLTALYKRQGFKENGLFFRKELQHVQV